MLPGSPRGGRRRRLIKGVKGAFSDNAYAAVQDSSSSRDVRKRFTQSSSTRNNHNETVVFQPTFNASEEHGYRIDVAQDGSMITAVPIHHAAAGMNSNNAMARRSSPMMYSDDPNASIHQSMSRHGLLDARGNQRQKMKRLRPPTTMASSVGAKQSTPIDYQHDIGRSPIRLARDHLKKAKGLVPTFAGSPHRQRPQNQSVERGKSKVTWDLDEQSTTESSTKNNVQTNTNNNIDDMSFGSFPILANHSFGKNVDDTKHSTINTKETEIIHKSDLNGRHNNGDAPFDTILQRRMEEIKSRQAELKKAMTHKDMMKGTLISAFDQNLEKNRKQMNSLEEELETIRWHLSLEDHERDKNGSMALLRQRMKENDSHSKGPAEDPMPSFDLESVGDPSITADTDSVADLFSKGKVAQKKVKGVDPPARPSPSPPTDEESIEEFRQSQSAGLETTVGFMGSKVPANSLKKPIPTRLQNERPLPPRPRNSSAKTVHFNLPHESVEPKFDPSDSADNPSTSFVEETENDDEDFSWQGEHYDVDMYDDQSGGLISSEHHDVYKWSDNKRHVMTTEHYVRENHHIHEQNERQQRSQQFSGSAGVSSASVEPDLDLSFVHSVAAVVIQTAVRRFLAELVAEERRYAVQVIQSSVWNWWMGLRFRRESPCRVAPVSFERNPRQRIKRVMFEDEYVDISNFAATEIQRCFRGWLARDTLEVDDFAATTIQRVFRGWWMRETMEVDRYCAVEIQRIVRGHLCRMNYIYDLYCITVVQSICRRFLAFNQSAVRLANVLYIQAIYRGYRVRSELSRFVVEGQEVAATLIQSQWRSYDAQMNYINTLADILIVQSVARRWLILRREDVKSLNINKQKHMLPQYMRKQVLGQDSVVMRPDSHNVWKEHRLKVVAKKKQAHNNDYPETYSDIFSEDGIEDNRWYGANVSETSNILQNWRGRR